MSRIISLQSENVKRLKAIKIVPKGSVVVVGGDNEQGKSSVLDSLLYSLTSAKSLPEKPVREGQKKAKVEILLDDGLKITRTITPSGGGTLTIENADGDKLASPQSVLDKLMGKYTFDPVRFLSLKKEEQREELRKIAGIDFSELDTEYKRIYSERTDLNKEVEKLRAKIQVLPHHKDVTDEKERSAAEILKELAGAQEKNLGRKSLADKVDSAVRDLNKDNSDLAQIDMEIKSLEERLQNLRGKRSAVELNVEGAEERLSAARNALESFVEIPVAEIQARLADVETYNRKVRENLAWNAVVKEGREKAARVDAITSRIESIAQEKKDTLAAAKFPVPGLSFDENGVLFEDLPFEQASSARKLRVSVAIAAAANPKLRVMLVREGSFLDEKALAELGKLAEEFDLQVWVERVSQGAECSVIISDGWVKGEEGTEEPEKKPAAKTTEEDEDLPF